MQNTKNRMLNQEILFNDIPRLIADLILPLNNSPCFKFQVFIDGRHIEILRCGKNGIYAVVIKGFGNHFLFVHIFLCDGFVIYVSKFFLQVFRSILAAWYFQKK